MIALYPPPEVGGFTATEDKDQVPSNLQIQRMKMLEEEGNYCAVCKSFDHAVRELKWYMGVGLNQNRKLECDVNEQ